MKNLQEKINFTLQKIDELSDRQNRVISEHSLLEQKESLFSDKIFKIEQQITRLQKKIRILNPKKLKKNADIHQNIQTLFDLAKSQNQSLEKTSQALINDTSALIENAVKSQRIHLDEEHQAHLKSIQIQLDKMIEQKLELQKKSMQAKSHGISLHEKIGLFKSQVQDIKSQNSKLDEELETTYQQLCHRHALAVDEDSLNYVLRYATNFHILNGTYWRMAIIALEQEDLYKAFAFLSFMNQTYSRFYAVHELFEKVKNQIIEEFQFENMAPINFYRKARTIVGQPDVVIALCLLSISIDREYRFYIAPYRLLIETLINKDAWFEADLYINKILNFEGLPDKGKFRYKADQWLHSKKKNRHNFELAILFDRTDATKEDIQAFRIEMIELFKQKITLCEDVLLLQKILKTRFYQENYSSLRCEEKSLIAPYSPIQYINEYTPQSENQEILTNFPDTPPYLKAWIHYLHQNLDAVMDEIPYFKEIKLSELSTRRYGAGL